MASIALSWSNVVDVRAVDIVCEEPRPPVYRHLTNPTAARRPIAASGCQSALTPIGTGAGALSPSSANIGPSRDELRRSRLRECRMSAEPQSPVA
jgi:hypothetical protein